MINDDYLNYNRLEFFFNKLKTLFASKDDLNDIKGEKGDPGIQGVSISKVEQTVTSTSDGGINTITVTLSDGTTSTFNVKNGSKGSTGLKGDAGEKGDKGDTGAIGATGTRGSMIYWGTAITGTSTTATIFNNSGVSSALVNDLYINTTNWNIYQCTTSGVASTAKWVYRGNIKGAAGTNATTTAVATTSANGLMSKEMVQKLGAIDGITSDINSESNSIAASSKMVHDLNSNLSELSNGLSDIAGTVLTKSADGFVLNSNAYTSVLSLALSAGTYMVTQYVNFPGGGAGIRAVRLSCNNVPYIPSPQQLVAASGERIQMSYCTFIKINGTATLGFQAYQASGASMELGNFIYRVLKIV